MAPEYVPDMTRQAMQVTMMVNVPTLLVSFVVRLFAVVFQAATQPGKQTLSSIPKLLAVAITVVLAGPWIVAVIVDYTRGVLASIPNYAG